MPAGCVATLIPTIIRAMSVVQLTKEQVMVLRRFVVLVLMSVGGAAFADSFDLNLSNTAAQFQYAVPSGVSVQGKAELYASFFYNNSNTLLGTAGFRVLNSQINGVSIGVGVEGLLATIKDNPDVRSNASAIALAGQVRFTPMGMEQLGLVGEVHYAPSIITYGDATRYSQVDARVEFALSPQTLVYAGYRQINFGIRNQPDATPDNGGHIGVKFSL
jgi:hypothetical protein